MQAEATRPSGKLGTFAGVFTPSILTILGIILFLRLGYVTGSAGLARALSIMAIANLISLLTSMSLAAVATNMRVKSGGDYYLISRTLGRQFGGAIGIVLFLAQSVSVAFYTIGFAEAVIAIAMPHPWLNVTAIALAATFLLFLLAWLGADWATRFQYVVMSLLIAALFSFYVGGLSQWQPHLLVSNWAPPADAPPFWLIFAIFFPAVTGFTQGVSMSGDLADSGRSLPLGTFLAVAVSAAIYLSVTLVFAGVLPNQVMMDDYQSIKLVARFPSLIDAGVIAATLSSALASFLGGPRILQALAADKIFPIISPFASGAGPANNPRRAVLLTGGIAAATISLGKLDLVAHVVSMFFLISYGLINYATFYEARTESPSFRPRFRWFSKYLSLAGFFLCAGVILALDLQNGLVAIAILIAIHQYLQRTSGPSRWVDSSTAHALQVIRQQLLAIAHTPDHDRNWRPHILAFTDDEHRRDELLTFAQWLEGGSGLVTAVRILEGSPTRLRRSTLEAADALERDLRRKNLKVFPLTIQSETLDTAMPILLQSYGIGPLHANTVLVNLYDQSDSGLRGLHPLKYIRRLKRSHGLGFNIILFHFRQARWEGLMNLALESRRIDVWWRNDATSRLMLLLAYLMSRHPEWSKAKIRVVVIGQADSEHHEEEIALMLDEARIAASPEFVPDMLPETVVEVSGKSAFVFLPFDFSPSQLTDCNGFSLERSLPRLPPAALVFAAKDIDLDAEPEEGTPGELAAAMDTLEEAEKQVEQTRKNLEQAKKRVDAIRASLSEAEEREEQAPSRQLAEELEAAEEEEKKAFRKAAKVKAKADDAARTVEELGGQVDEEET